MFNEAQCNHLSRLRLISYNELDGHVVAESLQSHCELWDAFVVGRFDFGVLIELRDLSEGYINADTIMLTTDLKRWPELLAEIKTWKASEIGYVTAQGKIWGTGCDLFKNIHSAFGGGLEDNKIVVRIWWD